MNIRSIYLPVLIAIVLGSFSNSVGQVSAVKLQKMTADADLIFTGKVTEQKSEWNEDKSRIYTEVTLEVEEYLKGTGNHKKITIVHPGGEVGEVGEIYTHIPTFQDDEEVLLFAKQYPTDSRLMVLYGNEGKISLFNDEITGEKVTSRNKKLSVLKDEIKAMVRKQ